MSHTLLNLDEAGDRFLVVGIGASAGSIQLSRFSFGK